MSWAAVAAEGTGPPAALLLTARDALPDRNFDGSTIIVTNRIASGPFGIIVNRPTPLTVARLFPELRGAAHAGDSVYFGGPVDLVSVSFLLQSRSPPENAVEIVAGVYLSRDVALLRRLLARGEPAQRIRVFIGYAGWEPEQLEAEIARGDWKVAPGSADAIFDAKPEHAWPAPAPQGQRS